MPNETVPLLTSGMQVSSNRLVVKKEAALWMSEDEDEDEDVETLLAKNKKRSTSLIITDALILILQVLQLYCVLFSLSLRWTWPQTWLTNTRWILFFNLDIWDFLKLNTNGTYKSVQSYHTPSASIPIAYWQLLLIWAFILFIGLLLYIIVYACIRSSYDPASLVRIAKLQRVYLILFQVLAIPFGVLVARIFHCNDTGYVDIDNTLFCFLDHHWAYIVPATFLAILLYIVLPVWMIYHTRTEMLSMPSDRHEAYLQLKETEYNLGMDVGWMVGHFHIFSSFKKYGAYLRPTLFFSFLIILALFAGAHSNIKVQSVAICVFIFILFVAFAIVRPYRIASYNGILGFSFLILSVDSMLGALLSLSSPSTITSVWLLPSYQLYVVASVNSFWLLVIVIFLIYAISRELACCKGCCKCCRKLLWPTLTANKIYKLSEHTRKFVKAILKGRVILEKIVKMPPLFAPAHELGRQIHIINAYCREAEFLNDPIQNSLWDLLDELIEAHSRVAPKSLFAESVKDSIRSTATELMRMMPMFTRRLAQREYDFLLMRPVKRRLLLKMYCMGLFLNHRRDTAARHRLTVPYLQKVWKPVEVQHEIEEPPDDGYYEDMYPEYDTVDPRLYQPETAVGMELIDFHEAEGEIKESKFTIGDDLDNLSDEQPLTPVTINPISATTYTNLVFENDDISSDEESPSSTQQKHSEDGAKEGEDEAPKDFAV